MDNFAKFRRQYYEMKVDDFGTLRWEEDWGKPDPRQDVTNKPVLKMRSDL